MPKISQPHQIELALTELGFPGRDTVTAGEIAEKLGCDLKHIHNLIDEGHIVAANIARRQRGAYRIPVSAYYAWLTTCLTAMPAENPVLNLETGKLIQLFRQLAERLELRGEHPITLLKNKK
jgi:hypothetical protein